MVPNPKEVNLKSLDPKNIGRNKLVETLQKLGLDSKGKLGELRSRLIGHIAAQNYLDIDLKILQPMKMKVKELKEILGKLGLETLGARADLRSRLKEYISTNITNNAPEDKNDSGDETFDDILNLHPDHINFFDKEFSDEDDPISNSRNESHPPKCQREPSESSEDNGT